MILTNCENCTQTRNKSTLIPSIGSLFCSSPRQKKVTQKRESRVIREALCPLTQGFSLQTFTYAFISLFSYKHS
jgi:hypothetical protein